MRTLIEEFVGAVAVSQVEEAPRFSCRCGTTLDHILINEDPDGSCIALKIASLLVRFCYFRWFSLRILLRRTNVAMTEPFLQLEQRHRLTGIVQLRGDG